MVLCIREVLRIRWWRSKKPCGTNLKEMIAGNREIAALRYNYILMLYMYSKFYTVSHIICDIT